MSVERINSLKIGGATVYSGVPTRKYSRVLKKLTNDVIFDTQLVALDETEPTSDARVKLNSATDYPVGMIVSHEDYSNGGVGREVVGVTVAMEDREDFVMYSSDTFTKGDIVFAGANGAVSNTGTIPVGIAMTSSASELGCDGVIRDYFIFKSAFNASNVVNAPAPAPPFKSSKKTVEQGA